MSIRGHLRGKIELILKKPMFISAVGDVFEVVAGLREHVDGTSVDVLAEMTGGGTLTADSEVWPEAIVLRRTIGPHRTRSWQ